MNNIDTMIKAFSDIVDKNSNKTILFGEVEETAYEFFYYSFFPDRKCKYYEELVDEGILDSTKVESIFEEMASIVRQSTNYDASKRNVISVILNGETNQCDYDLFDKKVGLYQIKKEWKNRYFS